MKSNKKIRYFFSAFFALAIAVHIYYLIVRDQQPIWWHFIYFITYGICWKMFFSSLKIKKYIYLLSSLFPFITHLYYGYKHLEYKDAMFWICIVVCLFLSTGYYFVQQINLQSEDV